MRHRMLQMQLPLTETSHKFNVLATDKRWLMKSIIYFQPVVKLLINRHNNKYSYTNTSDDNLLKNIELFDKLSLRFSGRILFIKDVIGSSEICCWSFYGNGRKVAEVSRDNILIESENAPIQIQLYTSASNYKKFSAVRSVCGWELSCVNVLWRFKICTQPNSHSRTLLIAPIACIAL